MKEKRISKGIIKNWIIRGSQVHGQIYDDEHWKKEWEIKDGEAIHTSLIEEITVKTRNTIYKLDPDSAK